MSGLGFVSRGPLNRVVDSRGHADNSYSESIAEFEAARYPSGRHAESSGTAQMFQALGIWSQDSGGGKP